MDRRDFLRVMLASAAAESVDFERLLWMPKPIITVPAMSMNTEITVEWITQDVIGQLRNMSERWVFGHPYGN